MAKKLNPDPETIPTWLRLERYKKQEQLKLHEWYQHLKIRSYFLTDLKHRSKHIGSPSVSDLKFLDLIKNDPFFIVGNEHLSIDSDPDLLTAMSTRDDGGQIASSALTFLSVQDLYLLKSKLGVKASLAELGKLWPQLEKGKLNQDQDLRLTQLARTPVYADVAERNLLLKVNLDIDPQILTKQFEQLLQSSFLKRPKRRTVRPPPIKQWIKYNLIAYIDLRIWAAISGYDVPRRAMADALAPHGTMDEDVLRKTVEPMALKALNPSSLQNLKQRAALHSGRK